MKGDKASLSQVWSIFDDLKEIAGCALKPMTSFLSGVKVDASKSQMLRHSLVWDDGGRIFGGELYLHVAEVQKTEKFSIREARAYANLQNRAGSSPNIRELLCSNVCGMWKRVRCTACFQQVRS